MPAIGAPLTAEERTTRSFKRLIHTIRLVVRRDTGGLSPDEYKRHIIDMITEGNGELMSAEDIASIVYDDIMKKLVDGIADRQSGALSELERRMGLIRDILRGK